MNKEVVLWETNWEFNRAVLLNHLMMRVINNGGKLIGWKGWNSFETEYELHNRFAIKKAEETKTIMEAADDFVRKCEHAGKKVCRKKDSELMRSYNEALCISKRYLKSQFTSYVRFADNGYSVYVEMDDNPFFPFYFCKAKVNEELRTEYNYYLEQLPTTWWTDALLTYTISEEEIDKIASMLYEFLISAKGTSAVTRKRRSPVINGKYHYIYEKEKRVEMFECIEYRPMEWKESK